MRTLVRNMKAFCSGSLVCVLVGSSAMMFTGCASLGIGKYDPKWEDLVREATEELNRPAKASQYNTVAAHAEELYTKAVEVADKKYGADSVQVATCLGYLGSLYRNRQDWRKAAQAYKRLLEIKDKVDPDGRETKQFHLDYEGVQEKLKEYGLDDETLNKKKSDAENPPHKKKKKKKKAAEQE